MRVLSGYTNLEKTLNDLSDRTKDDIRNTGPGFDVYQGCKRNHHQLRHRIHNDPVLDGFRNGGQRG